MNDPKMRIAYALVGAFLLGGSMSAQSNAAQARLLAEKHVASNMTFIENRSQWDPKVTYRMTTGPATCWFIPGGWVIGLEKLAPFDLHADTAVAPETPARRQTVARADFAMNFENGAAVKPEGMDQLATRYHYSRGSDSSRWVRDARGYRSLRYRSIYPGIDSIVRERDGLLTYDLRLHPGARLDDIVIAVEGVQSLSLAVDGSMVIKTESGDLRQTAPVTWSIGPDGAKRPHASSFRLLGKNRYGFDVRGWDGRSELVIDPGLDWGSFLGGGAHETILKVTLDSQDRIAVVGLTASSNLPKKLNNHGGGFNDAYMTLIDPSLNPTSQVLWTHYLGGSYAEIAFDVAYAGGLFSVVGYTNSRLSAYTTGYPTTGNALQRSYAGGPIDGFITQLDAKGAIRYSSYFGSSGNDRIMAVKTGGPAGFLTIAGYTNGSSFPTTAGVIQPKLAGGYDAFITRIDPTAKTPSAQLKMSTYLGGSSDEGDWSWVTAFQYDRLDLHVAKNGNTTIGLYTRSTNLKTKNPYQGKFNGGRGDIFLARLNFSLTTLLYGSYVGSNGNDFLMQLQVDQSGVISAAGGTSGTNFRPTTGAFQPNTGGGWDCVLFRINPGLAPTSQLVYSTYLGGAGTDYALAMTTESSGVMTACGITVSTALPCTVGAWNTTYPSPASSTGFVLRLDPKGYGKTDLHYLSYVGAGSIKATGYELLTSVALTRDGYAVLGGSTDNLGFNTKGGFAPKYAGGISDCVLVKMDLLPTWVLRRGKASPSCVNPIWLQVNSQPTRPNPKFEVICNQAPPKSAGLLVLGSLFPNPLPILGITLYVSPLVVLAPTVSDKNGSARQILPVPATLPKRSGAAIQWLWLAPKRCKGGILSASHALEIL